MSWSEVRIDVDHGEAERWADRLLDAGALSVQAEDADADSPDEQPIYGEPGLGPAGAPRTGLPAGDAAPPAAFGWRRTRLAVLLERNADAVAIVADASAALGRPAPRIVDTRVVEDRDWIAATQAQFEPIPIGERLLITPSWHAADAGDATHADRLRLIVDPGLAFGTGSHPTTRVCLEWLDQAPIAGRTVLDYGCGSGILAIAAARLGAIEVVALDIDPVAVDAAAANAARNGVAITVASSAGRRPADADVVVANILSSPLKLLAPLLASLVRPGGSLVLSGVLERQVDEVAASYASLLPVRCWRTLDGWACLVGRRP
ncbi:MAG: 50S ribosomal protein L11 methyltransferase [Lautropia sp.]